MSATVNEVKKAVPDWVRKADLIWNAYTSDYPDDNAVVYAGIAATCAGDAPQNPNPKGTLANRRWRLGFLYAWDWLAEERAEAVMSKHYYGFDWGDDEDMQPMGHW